MRIGIQQWRYSAMALSSNGAIQQWLQSCSEELPERLLLETSRNTRASLWLKRLGSVPDLHHYRCAAGTVGTRGLGSQDSASLVAATGNPRSCRQLGMLGWLDCRLKRGSMSTSDAAHSQAVGVDVQLLQHSGSSHRRGHTAC